MKTLFFVFAFALTSSLLFPQPVLKCDETGTFSEGMISFRKGELWGFSDSTGKVVIPPAFYNSMNTPFFSDGLAVVQLVKGGKFGAINKTGTLVVPDNFFILTRFGSGVAIAYKPADARIPTTRAHCKIVSNAGSVVNDSTINDHSFQTWFTEGLSAFRNAGQYGFLNTDGSVAIDAKYNDARIFMNGMAVIKKGPAWTYIDKTGKQIDNFTTTIEPGGFADVVATFTDSNGKKGAVDKTGKVVIKPVYEQLATFENGYSTGKYTDEKTWETVYEIISSSGKVIRRFSPTIDKGKYYELRSGFKNGLAVIIEDYSKYGFVDTKGDFAIKPNFSDITVFASGRAYAKQTDPKTGVSKEGYIDRTGKFAFYIEN